MREQGDLSGRSALVTGASRRLGRAMALELADRGAGVVVHYRTSEEAAEATADAIREVGGVAWTLQGDLEDADGVDGLYTQACELAAGPSACW